MSETRALAKKPNAYWNGEPAFARRVMVGVGKALKPTWWCAELEGTVRPAVEVTYEGQTFFLDNEKGEGWQKVTFGYGSPRYGHRSLPDDSVVVEEIADEEQVATDEVIAEHLEARRQKMIEADKHTPKPEQAQTFREFHNEMRRYRRRVFVREDQGRKPIVNAPSDRPKGKKAIKAAKRARVAELKSHQ